MTTKLFLLSSFLFISVAACTKNKDADQNPSPGSGLGITATKVTEINIMGYTPINLNQVLLVYNSKTIRNFDLHDDGDVKITFHGKAGRSLLGDHDTTTNLANFKIQNGDTVRIVYKNDTTNLITDIGDTYNSGIFFTARSWEPKDTAIKRFENFVKELPNKKWKASPLSP